MHSNIVGITVDHKKALIKRRGEYLTVKIPPEARNLAEKYISGNPGYKTAGTQLYKELIKNLFKI